MNLSLRICLTCLSLPAALIVAEHLDRPAIHGWLSFIALLSTILAWPFAVATIWLWRRA